MGGLSFVSEGQALAVIAEQRRVKAARLGKRPDLATWFRGFNCGILLTVFVAMAPAKCESEPLNTDRAAPTE